MTTCIFQKCSNESVIHVMDVVGNKISSCLDVCNYHSREIGPFRKETQSIVKSVWSNNKNDTVSFDLEYVVFFDEFAEAGIYFREKGGDRRFCSKSGYFESTFLYNVLKNPPPDRPFIHTATISAIQALGGTVKDVLVDKFEYKVIHAKVNIIIKETIINLDVRPTDAYIIAIICNVPIFVKESVLLAIGT